MAPKPDVLMPALWELASQLRAMRDAAGISASELGMRIGKSQSHISRWEAAKMTPRDTDVSAVCDALGIGTERRSRLLALVLRARQPHGHGPTINRELGQLIAFENQAMSMVQVAPLMIPGILQSPNYARTIMQGGDYSESEIEKRVAVRMKRQDMMLANHTRFEALIADWTLDAPPCQEEIMTEQVKHLLMLQDRGDIEIRRVPMGGRFSSMYVGAFLLLRFEKMAPIAQLEVHHYSTLVTEERDLKGLERAVVACRADADSPEETRRLLEGMIS